MRFVEILVTKISILETRSILDTKLVENRASDIRNGLQYSRIIMGIEGIGMLEKELRDDIVRSYVPCAASFAHHGLLKYPGNGILLRDINLSSVPAEHMASLVSIARTYVSIRNVSGCSLVPILDNVKCQLSISYQSLDREETEALARVIKGCGIDRSVYLDESVKLDMSTLSSDNVNVLVEHVDEYKKSCKVTKIQKIKKLCNIV